MMNSLLSLATLALLPSVLAHGTMQLFNNDAGPALNSKTPSVIRMTDSPSPVTDLTSSDLSCGNGAANLTAQQTATVTAGSQMSFRWISGAPPTLWPHNMGPIMTYIASCGGDCKTFNSMDAQWVKIGQAGYTVPGTKLGDSSGIWTMGTTYYKGLAYNLTLPSTIPNGNYLIRNENIALHRANTAGGAEFYPNCAQVAVTGGPSGSLDTTNAVKFPGAYSPNDPGILVDVYTPSDNTYQFPGPALYTGASSASNSSAGGDNTVTAGTTPTVTTPAAATSLTPTNTQLPATITPAATSSADNSVTDGGDDDCDTDTDDGSSNTDQPTAASEATDDGGTTLTVWQTVTVTVVPPHRHTKTAYTTVTVTGSDDGAGPTPTASADDSTETDDDDATDTDTADGASTTDTTDSGDDSTTTDTSTADPSDATTTLNPAGRRMKRVHARKFFWAS